MTLRWYVWEVSRFVSSGEPWYQWRWSFGF